MKQRRILHSAPTGSEMVEEAPASESFNTLAQVCAKCIVYIISLILITGFCEEFCEVGIINRIQL